MRKKKEIVIWIVYLLIVAAVVLASKYVYIWILNTNWPDWVKWLLLK
jgi:hypothetical protein